MDQATMTPRDYLAIVRRRKWQLVLPGFLIMVLALAIALLWPPTYRSQATILVEQSEIPQDLVTTLIDEYLERRLEAITRRVMVSENLIRIIERYDLYPDERAKSPIASVVESMRGYIAMTPITTQVTNPQSGRTTASTVAFSLSFDHRSPETAQRVTNELVSLYLNENLRQRRESAGQTTTFLREERERLEQRLNEVGRRLTEFKAANNGALPEQMAANQQAMLRLEQELRDVDRNIQALREKEALYAAQLALTEPFQLYTAAARNAPPTPAAQLEAQRLQLATLRARYGETHPDVVRTAREVAALERTVGASAGDRAAAERARDAARAEHEAVLQRYTPEHPDVQAARRRLDAAEAAVRAAQAGTSGATRPDNPAYITLEGQLAATRADLGATIEQRKGVVETLERYRELMTKAPLVEREYSELMRALAELTALRDDVARRETTAQLGQTLETELKGERFSLIEPPTFPLDPVKPNKLLVMLIGFVLAAGSGIGMVTVLHLLDDAVYTVKDVASVVGEPPLVVVPRVVTVYDRALGWALRLLVVAVVATLVGLLLYWIHTTFIPLDVLAYDIQRRVASRLEGLTAILGGGGQPAGQ
jgi:uncharacterized protein involved in exopolysaccharide biosynthesis